MSMAIASIRSKESSKITPIRKKRCPILPSNSVRSFSDCLLVDAVYDSNENGEVLFQTHLTDVGGEVVDGVKCMS